MRLSDIAFYSCKTAIAERKRFVWVVAGLALGVGLYVATGVLAAGYAKLVAPPFSELNTDLIIQRAVEGGQEKNTPGRSSIRLPFSNQPVSDSEIEALRKLAGVESVSPAIMLWYQAKNDSSVIAGVYPDSSVGPAAVMSWIDKGRKVENPGEIVVESHYAKFHRIGIDDPVFFEGHRFKVVGIAKIKKGAPVAAANYYLGIADAGTLGGMDAGGANMLFATLKKGVAPEDVRTQMAEIVPGAMLSTADNIGGMLKGFARIGDTMSKLVGAVVLGFAILLSSWLIAGSLNERSWQIGLMRTVGWQRKDILAAVAAETILLGLLGGLLGLALGYLAAVGLSFHEVSLALPWNLSGSPGAAQSGGVGQTVSFPVTVQPWTISFAMGVAAFSATITGVAVAGKWCCLEAKKALDRA